MSAWAARRGELAIAQAILYLGTAPKSNALYKAFGEAMRAAKGVRQLDATGAYSQRADQTDEATRLWRRVRL